jgi:hypothetical protein
VLLPRADASSGRDAVDAAPRRDAQRSRDARRTHTRPNGRSTLACRAVEYEFERCGGCCRTLAQLAHARATNARATQTPHSHAQNADRIAARTSSTAPSMVRLDGVVAAALDDSSRAAFCLALRSASSSLALSLENRWIPIASARGEIASSHAEKSYHRQVEGSARQRPRSGLRRAGSHLKHLVPRQERVRAAHGGFRDEDRK